jgi:hypothetical protein
MYHRRIFIESTAAVGTLSMIPGHLTGSMLKPGYPILTSFAGAPVASPRPQATPVPAGSDSVAEVTRCVQYCKDALI